MLRLILLLPSSRSSWRLLNSSDPWGNCRRSNLSCLSASFSPFSCCICSEICAFSSTGRETSRRSSGLSNLPGVISAFVILGEESLGSSKTFFSFSNSRLWRSFSRFLGRHNFSSSPTEDREVSSSSPSNEDDPAFFSWRCNKFSNNWLCISFSAVNSSRWRFKERSR